MECLAAGFPARYGEQRKRSAKISSTFPAIPHVSSMPPVLEAPRHICSIVQSLNPSNLLVQIVLLWPEQDSKTSTIADAEWRVGTATLFGLIALSAKHREGGDSEFDESGRDAELEALCGSQANTEWVEPWSS